MKTTDLNYFRERIEIFLEKNLLNSADPLHQAMRYSVLNGGKRLRPLLVYAAGQVSGAPMEKLDYCAAAVECIHAYSLIHDDLPSMDDDDFRRGKPSCHKKFDEATAILAGDALQSVAFEWLAENNHIELIKILAGAIGAEGMVLGQSIDIQHDIKNNTKIPEKLREAVHRNKTAKLMVASVHLGALCGTLSEEYVKKLILFAENFGLAFQYHDDFHDGEVVSFEQAEFFYQKAENYLQGLPDTELFLRILAAMKSNNNVMDNANH